MEGGRKGRERGKEISVRWTTVVLLQIKNHLSFYLKVSPKVHASKRTTVQLILVLVSEGQVDLIYQLVHIG